MDWCEYNQCECYEVNEIGSEYKCKYTDSDECPCGDCSYYEDRSCEIVE